MTRRLVLILAASAVAGFAQEAPVSAPLPKAESILDRYIEVTGGKAIYEMRKSEVTVAKLEMAAQGIKGTLTVFAMAPDKVYTTMELEGVGKIESGVANGVSWEKSFMQGPRIREGAEKVDSLRDATFNAPLHWRKL